MAGIVLLSGGLDSTVALALFLERANLDLALTFDYGQRAVEREIEASSWIASHYGIPHRVIELSFLKEQTKSALVFTECELPQISLAELDDITGRALETAKSVWVPNRNALFINIAAVFAENLASPNYIITGFNREEAATFPDNSEGFISAINQSLNYSALKDINVVSPTLGLSKQEIVEEALRLKVPIHQIWSCYRGYEQLCGSCESCTRFKRALRANNQELLLQELFIDPS